MKRSQVMAAILTMTEVAASCIRRVQGSVPFDQSMELGDAHSLLHEANENLRRISLDVCYEESKGTPQGETFRIPAYKGANKIKLIKAIRAMVPVADLQDAKHLAESGGPLLRGVPADLIEPLQRLLNLYVGGDVKFLSDGEIEDPCSDYNPCNDCDDCDDIPW